MASYLAKYCWLMGRLMPWLIALMAATAIVLSTGSQPVALLIFILSLPLFFIRLSPDSSVSTPWLTTLILPLIAAVPLFIGSATGEALDAPSRYFVAALVLLALRRVTLDPRLFLRGATIGGILAIVLNIGELQELRVNLGVGHLETGYVSVLLISLSLAQFHFDRDRMIWRAVAVLGIICLVVAVMKTGTRGAWPALLCVFFLQFALTRIKRRSRLLIGLAGVVMFATVVLTVPSIKQRLDLTVYEVTSYYKENNRASSVGYRLDFWHIALQCLRESPVWGVSYQRRSEIMAMYIDDHPASASIGTDGRSSSHNEILNALAKTGLLGGLAILLLYLVPLRYFIGRFKRERGSDNQYLAIAGTGIALTMIICGATEAPLMNVRVGTSYAFLLIVLYRLLQQDPRQKEFSGLSANP